MTRCKLYKLIGFSVLLIGAFYLSGLIALSCDWFHNSLVLSSGVFTAVFAAITAIGAKIYHLFFF